MKLAIEVSNLSKQFDEKVVLDDININVLKELFMAFLEIMEQASQL